MCLTTIILYQYSIYWERASFVVKLDIEIFRSSFSWTRLHFLLTKFLPCNPYFIFAVYNLFWKNVMKYQFFKILNGNTDYFSPFLFIIFLNFIIIKWLIELIIYSLPLFYIYIFYLFFYRYFKIIVHFF